MDEGSVMDPDNSTAMVHFKYKTFSEEVCRPVAFVGGKDGLLAAVLAEFSDVLPPTVAKEDVMLAVSCKPSCSDKLNLCSILFYKIDPR